MPRQYENYLFLSKISDRFYITLTLALFSGFTKGQNIGNYLNNEEMKDIFNSKTTLHSTLFLVWIAFNLSGQSISVNPSPFNFTATANYTLQSNDSASIHIFNRWGQCVDTVLAWSYQLAGVYQKTVGLTGQPENNYVVLFKYGTKKQNFNVVNTTQPLGIRQNEKLNKISIYPNPVNDYLNIASIQVPRNTTFTLVDHLGKVVFYSSDLKPPYQINMEMLPKGIYFLKIKTQKSEDSFKVVKE